MLSVIFLFLNSYWIFPLWCGIACWLCISLAIHFLTSSRFLEKNLLKQSSFRDNIEDHITNYILSNKDSLLQSAVSEKNMDKIMPQIEAHIEEFLTKKVPEQLPMIAMFLGEKTTHQIKEVFMKELRVLFPQVIVQYANTAADESKIKNFIHQQISNVLTTLMNTGFSKNMRSIFFRYKCYSFLFGLLFGCLGSLIIYLFA